MIRLFRVSFPRSVVGLILSEALVVTSCFLIAVWAVAPDFELYMRYENGGAGVSVGVATVLLCMYFQSAYSEFSVRSKSAIVRQAVLAVAWVLIAQAMLGYISRDLMLSRWVTVVACGLLLVVTPAWRIVYKSLVYRGGLGVERVLFLGTNAMAVEIAEALLSRPEIGLRVAGFVDDTCPEQFAKRHLGKLADFRRVVEKVQPDRIVVGLAEQREKLPVQALIDFRFSGIHIEEAVVTYEATFGRIPIRSLRPSQLIFTQGLGPERSSIRIQNIYSVAFGAVGLALAAPVMLLVALAVRLTSKGPVLYRQRRVGVGGELFTVYKFRSMRVDAEASTGAVWATRNDPRVTSVGRFLRRTRLDELPQLFNVVRGEMAIVGPRPERPEFVETLSEQIPFYRQRHCVKPGVTGWAQINYKYGETIEDTIVKLEYDLYYIKNLSPSLDAYIIFQTIKVMLFTRSGN